MSEHRQRSESHSRRLNGRMCRRERPSRRPQNVRRNPLSSEQNLSTRSEEKRILFRRNFLVRKRYELSTKIYAADSHNLRLRFVSIFFRARAYPLN